MNMTWKPLLLVLCALLVCDVSAKAQTSRLWRHSKVKPSIARDFVPAKTLSAKKAKEIESYKACMYGETPLDRAEYALLLNLKWRNSPQLGGTPEKIGYEVCFTDALGFVRYSDQVAIDAAKGIDLVEVSPLFIDFPSDKANTIPFERRYARPWVKTYIETLAQDLHEFLAREHRGQEVPRLRMGSLVRSEVDQRRLRSTANCSTEICSTHLTGATIDISNNSNYVSPEVRKWILARLIQDRKEGKIVMIQEFYRPHFHVLVVPPEFVRIDR